MNPVGSRSNEVARADERGSDWIRRVIDARLIVEGGVAELAAFGGSGVSDALASRAEHLELNHRYANGIVAPRSLQCL